MNICVADIGKTSSSSSTMVFKQTYAYTVPVKGAVTQQEVSQQTSQQSNSSQVVCTNSHGLAFLCAKDNTCCGDICAGPGSICCQNQVGDGFACAPGNACCGNSCQAPGSRCCVGKGVDYPVTKDSKCAGWELGSRPCENRYGVAFYCSKDSSCCGDICGGAGSSCCKNQYGNDFVCAPGSKCGKNVCVADTGIRRRNRRHRRRSSSTTFVRQTPEPSFPPQILQPFWHLSRQLVSSSPTLQNLHPSCVLDVHSLHLAQPLHSGSVLQYLHLSQILSKRLPCFF